MIGAISAEGHCPQIIEGLIRKIHIGLQEILENDIKWTKLKKPHSPTRPTCRAPRGQTSPKLPIQDNPHLKTFLNQFVAKFSLRKLLAEKNCHKIKDSATIFIRKIKE
jgi:hypothetical protein